MELDPDCIRDVLLTVEKHSTFHQAVQPNDFVADGMSQLYGEEKLLYHIRQCDMAGFLVKAKFYMNGFVVRDISPAGHEFLANIREDTNWNKTKSVAKSVGSQSLKGLASIASQVVAALIQKNLHLDS